MEIEKCDAENVSNPAISTETWNKNYRSGNTNRSEKVKYKTSEITILHTEYNILGIINGIYKKNGISYQMGYHNKTYIYVLQLFQRKISASEEFTIGRLKTFELISCHSLKVTFVLSAVVQNMLEAMKLACHDGMANGLFHYLQELENAFLRFIQTFSRNFLYHA